MGGLTNLIGDVDGTIAQRSTSERERTLSKITDLLVQDAERLRSDQLAVFDHVIGRFAPTVPTLARADLAERLADLDNAPPNVVRSLALDEDIEVARSILTRSTALSDQDLIEVASIRGTEHMAAICDRFDVSESVTDVLVTKGGDDVCRAIAGNAGARFSLVARAELLDKSRSDDTLQDLLGARADLTEGELQRLVEIAREAAREQVIEEISASEREVAALVINPEPLPFDFVAARTAMRAITKQRPLAEPDIAKFASQHKAAETICAVAIVTSLPAPLIERLFRLRDDDLLLVIGKAQGWSWRTMRTVINMRSPCLPEPNAVSAEPVFDAISVLSARRAVLVLASSDDGPRLARALVKRDAK